MLFLLGGRKKDLNNYFNSAGFRGMAIGKARPLIPVAIKDAFAQPEIIECNGRNASETANSRSYDRSSSTQQTTMALALRAHCVRLNRQSCRFVLNEVPLPIPTQPNEKGPRKGGPSFIW